MTSLCLALTRNNTGEAAAGIGPTRDGGIEAKSQKVPAIPGGNSIPQDLHEVRSFVGLCSYYRRHIRGFTELAAPLYKLPTKGTAALTSAPILGFPREEALWYLYTDTSDVGTGAMLSQMQDGVERVIAYVSKSLEGSEQRYCTARKELLPVVRAFKHFKSIRAENHSEKGQ